MHECLLSGSHDFFVFFCFVYDELGLWRLKVPDEIVVIVINNNIC